jgi:thiol-disulfide isomerase/thioredoxin
MQKVMLIYANGCPACEAIKPIYEQVQKDFPGIQFESHEINTVQGMYFRYADKDPETGAAKVVIPNFFIFDEKLATDDNEAGFVGGFEGASEEELRFVLNAIAGAEQPE